MKLAFVLFSAILSAVAFGSTATGSSPYTPDYGLGGYTPPINSPGYTFGTDDSWSNGDKSSGNNNSGEDQGQFDQVYFTTGGTPYYSPGGDGGVTLSGNGLISLVLNDQEDRGTPHSPTPEPASFGLLALGAGFLFLLGRRRRAAAGRTAL